MILFLDFDGVLHPDEVYLERGRTVLRADGTLFMWAHHLADALANTPEVRIVLSTSWVRELRFSCARDALPTGLRAKVIGATWHSAMAVDEQNGRLGRDTWWDRATRYQQIRRYVERAKIADWIAIDDHPEGWAPADFDRLVTTAGDLGLSVPSAQVGLSVAVGNVSNAWAIADKMALRLGIAKLMRSVSPAELIDWDRHHEVQYLEVLPLAPTPSSARHLV